MCKGGGGGGRGDPRTPRRVGAAGAGGSPPCAGRYGLLLPAAAGQRPPQTTRPMRATAPGRVGQAHTPARRAPAGGAADGLDPPPPQWPEAALSRHWVAPPPRACSPRHPCQGPVPAQPSPRRRTAHAAGTRPRWRAGRLCRHLHRPQRPQPQPHPALPPTDLAHAADPAVVVASPRRAARAEAAPRPRPRRRRPRPSRPFSGGDRGIA
jgi:hypothetical protein